MLIENEVKLDFKDVLIKPKRSTLKSRSDVSLHRIYTFRHVKDYIWKGVPIMVANMDTTGTFEMANEMIKYNIFTCIHKHYELKEWTCFLSDREDDIYNYIAISIGINDLKYLEAVMSEHSDIRFICLDVANGYSEKFVEIVSLIRRLYPDKVLIAGNVVTREMTEELILKGADIIKIGIGPGSVCTTRKKTGVGYPQLSAIIECADAAHGLGGHIISDGGCTCPGDFAKAFAGGTDFIMSGGMFSGHTESGGELVERGGKKFKLFYGMSSKKAMEKHSGGVAEYRTSEGKEVLIPFRGPVKNTILDILGGIRSCCTYVGAVELKYLSKRTTFIRVTHQLNNIFS